MFKIALGVCAITSLVGLTGQIVYLKKRVKLLEDALFQFVRKAEFNNQHSNDQHSMVVSDIFAIVDTLYSIGVFDDDDLDRIRRQDAAEFLKRLVNEYGEKEGHRRFDIYTGDSEEGINLAFYDRMN